MTAEELLYHEAALLDARSFDQWLELYADDAIYWVPQREADDPGRDVSIAYDDRRRLHERVVRLTSGFAYSQDPPSRTCHVVGNVRVVAERGDELDVTSSLIVVEVRRNVQRLYAGPVEHTLVSADGRLLIRRKVIRLVNGDLPLGNLAFLI